MKKVISVVALAALVVLVWFGYKHYSAKKEIEAQAHDICYLYMYDKANPGVHGSYGPEYYTARWRQFESLHGPTGATSLDDFCRTHN